MGTDALTKIAKNYSNVASIKNIPTKTQTEVTK